MLAKAVIPLRAADHLQDFDLRCSAGIDAGQLAAGAENGKSTRLRVDFHILNGKAQQQDERRFSREEQQALKPFQPSLFDDMPERLANAANASVRCLPCEGR